MIYRGVRYDTIKDYSEATDAGNYKNLQQALTGLEAGNDAIYNGRRYTLAGGIIKAVDADTPTITYNGNVYTTLKNFADAHKLAYKSIHNALSKARKEGKDTVAYKQYTFYLDNDGNIMAVSK
ncbi:HAD hydrolase family protein [Acetivibrio straminisolvens]|uniref:HAD hydrolase family protein n=1 Tax=Acetivibrio straminisolvens TaxID=253314 RepID=UPI001FB0EFEB|nr:HAD hydrolase family protein [Acetivibrio straminisolvens]